MLKTPTLEKSVKIGGGKEADLAKEKEEEVEEEPAKVNKKIDRRRQRRKKTAEEKKEKKETNKADLKLEPKPHKVEESQGGGAGDETKVSSGTGVLIPPPSGLISDKYKGEKDQEIPQRDLFSDQIGEAEPFSAVDVQEKIAVFPSEEEDFNLLPSEYEDALSEESSHLEQDLDQKIKQLSDQNDSSPDLFNQDSSEETNDYTTSPASQEKNEDEPIF
jgi:hypothetical protein